MHISAEAIRRPPREKANRRDGTNSTNGLIQLLAGSCGERWKNIHRNIHGRRDRISADARKILDARLDALVCRSSRTPVTTHLFRVTDGRLQRIPTQPIAAAS